MSNGDAKSSFSLWDFLVPLLYPFKSASPVRPLSAASQSSDETTDDHVHPPTPSSPSPTPPPVTSLSPIPPNLLDHLHKSNPTVPVLPLFQSHIQDSPFRTPFRKRSLAIDTGKSKLTKDKTETLKDGIVTKGLSKRKRGGMMGKCDRLGSVAKRRRLVQDKATAAMNQSISMMYRGAKRVGYTKSQREYQSVVDMMIQVESRMFESNKVEMRRKAERDVRLGLERDVSEKESVSSSSWITSLRETIHAYLKSSPSPVVVEPAPITDVFDQLQAKDRELEKSINRIRLEKVKDLKKQLFPPLSDQDLERVRLAGTGDGTVVKAFNVDLQKNDMKTLIGSSWLNDEIINFYGQLCMDRATKNADKYPKIHIFNTFFYQKLQTDGYPSVRRWSKKDYVIFPVHLGSHWCCAILNFKLKRFEYYDSLHGENLKCLRIMREYLEKESMDKKKIAFDSSKWTNYSPKDCPAQNNGFDCGVAMEFTARGEEFLFRQKHIPYIRKRIAKEILDLKLMWW